MISYSVLTTLLASLFVTATYRLERGVQRFTIRARYEPTPDAPSVSICIPARNETHAMTQCLERVLASDYPKLEVIVFDDASADDTSILINSFAHAGVRFVPGTKLPYGWLGKNHALEVLAREASGTYILFLDVDTHVQPTTVSQLIGQAIEADLQMMSVIPGRNDVWRTSVLFGHLRYYWKIMMSSARFPATSSSLWLIRRRTLLQTIGGFGAHKSVVEPEQRLAGIIGPNAYRCYLSDRELGVSYEKRWTSQCETSRRLLYPMVGGSLVPSLVALLILVVLNLPLVFIVLGLIFEWSLLSWTAAVVLVLFSLLYGRYTYVIWRSNWWLGVLVWPVVVLQELVLFISSIFGYARGTITWKGRPIVAPKQTAAK